MHRETIGTLAAYSQSHKVHHTKTHQKKTKTDYNAKTNHKDKSRRIGRSRIRIASVLLFHHTKTNQKKTKTDYNANTNHKAKSSRIRGSRIWIASLLLLRPC